jgi:phage-related minor tail protein
MANSPLRVPIEIDPSGFESGGKKAEAALKRLAKTGEVSAGQIAAATRGLPAQFNDIASSLAGGQNPFLVLLQQGGQISDQFGGIKNAARGIASTLTPARIAIGLLAGGVAAAGLAFRQGSQEAEGYRRAIVLSGNAVGATVGQLDASAAAVGRLVGTQGKAAEVIAQLASTGRVSAGQINKLAEAAIRLERVGGPAIKQTVATFARLGEEPLRASIELNKGTNYLTASVLEQIRALEEQGRRQEAAGLAQATYAEASTQRAQTLEQSLGTLERAWQGAGDAAKKAWDFFRGLGRAESVQSRLAEVSEELERRRRAVGPNLSSRSQGLLDEQGVLQSDDRLLRREADKAANVARVAEEYQRAQSANQRWSDAALSNSEKINKALVDYRRNLAAINAGREQAGLAPVSAADVARQEAAIRASFTKATPAKKPQPLGAIQSASEQYRSDFLRSEKESDDQIAALDKVREREDARRAERQQTLLDNLVTGNARASADLIADERSRALAIIEIDRQLAETRVREAGLTGERLSQALGLVNERASLAQTALDSQINAGLERANAATVDSLTGSISEGILNGFRSGQGFADIFLNELKAQFAKTVLSPVIRPVVEAGNKALQDLLLGISKSISGSVSLGQSGQATAGDFFQGTTDISGYRAAGGPVYAGNAYVVGEKGPEVLQMGNQSGNVLPNQRASGLSVQPSISVHIDARSDQAQVAQLVAAGVQQGMQATMEHLRLRGVVQ